ncbi:MAG TPA: Rieske (2Fe-2S) protein [Polyangia bacterium]
MCGGLATGAVIASGALEAGCGNDVEPAPFVDATTLPGGSAAALLDLDPASMGFGQIAVRAAALPALQPIGGAVTVRLPKLTAGSSLPFAVPPSILLVHRAGPGDPQAYIAVDATCPHAGCPLGYAAQDQLIECPCHGSRFRGATDPSGCVGDVVHLPALAKLRAYVVDGAADPVLIDLKSNACLAPGAPKVVGGQITLALADVPELATVGGSKVFPSVEGFSDPLVLVRVDASTIAALDARCTHLGCTVAYAPARMDLECPCHGSIFALDGTVKMPPAPLPLRAFAVAFDGTTLVITVA